MSKTANSFVKAEFEQDDDSGDKQARAFRERVTQIAVNKKNKSIFSRTKSLLFRSGGGSARPPQYPVSAQDAMNRSMHHEQLQQQRQSELSRRPSTVSTKSAYHRQNNFVSSR